MLGIVYSGGVEDFDSTLIKVEVDVASGLPGWQMVGLPEKAVQEAKERVQSAVRNSGIKLESRRTTINLAPATHKKRGNQYDLPIAIGLLKAHNLLTENLDPFLFVGELSLTGELKPIQGTLLFALLAKQKKFKALVLPKINALEASFIPGVTVIGCETLAHALDFLKTGLLPPPPLPASPLIRPPQKEHDLSEIKGQAMAKRALEIAAAGRHHLLMIGSPGSGKSMLAAALPSILPPLSLRAAMEATKIYSACGLTQPEFPMIDKPPFRAPHHSISYAGLVGGGEGLLAPGEITLAHNGVLFLDELPEFRRDGLEMLRQPLELGWVGIVRVKKRTRFPARFQLIAAMNPCQCGFLGHPVKPCVCSASRVYHYRNKISGPLLDRIDLHVEVSPVPETDLFDAGDPETSAQIKERVMAAHQIQQKRYRDLPFNNNAGLTVRLLKEFCPLTPEAEKFLRHAYRRLALSARAYHRILKVSRTIADLAGAEAIETEHAAEAIQFRCLDQERL